MRDERYQSWQGQDNLFAAAIPIVLLVGLNNSLAATIFLFIVGGFWLKNRDDRYSDWVKRRVEQHKNYQNSDDTALSARMIADHLGLKFDEIDQGMAISDESNSVAYEENSDDKLSWDELEQRRLQLAEKLGKVSKPNA